MEREARPEAAPLLFLREKEIIGIMNNSLVLAVLNGLAEEQIGRARRGNPKRRGEISEAAFVLKAHELGFLVAKPWGDSEKYDFILDSGARLWRVQLKSTEVVHARGYEIQPIYSVYGKGKAGYTAEEIDALVVHIRPWDVWYVLPVEAFAPGKNLRFYPDIECRCALGEVSGSLGVVAVMGSRGMLSSVTRASAAELRSAWADEGVRPHTSSAGGRGRPPLRKIPNGR
jgi:hypothetical protein